VPLDRDPAGPGESPPPVGEGPDPTAAAVLHPIGIIRSPFTSTTGMPVQPPGAAGVRGTIELHPEYADGLKDLSGFSHIILIYHLHQAGPCRLRVVPFLDTEEHGIFATRSPVRPNPLGLSIVRLLEVRGSLLDIENVDILDGTPLLDIKPYIPAFDHWEVTATGWMTSGRGRVSATRADDRFKRD